MVPACRLDVQKVISYLICQTTHPHDVSNVQNYLSWALGWCCHCCQEDLLRSLSFRLLMSDMLEAFVKSRSLLGFVWVGKDTDVDVGVRAGGLSLNPSDNRGSIWFF